MANEALAARWYIRHEDVRNPANGVAYFGPFEESELTERLNDELADLLADSGDVEEEQLTDDDAASLFINPRTSWMNELARIHG